MTISIEQARQAKEAAKTQLVELPGIVGIGIGKVGADYAVKVNLRAALPANAGAPDRIAGVPVIFEVVGEIRKRQ
jgi:hypothetical protein